MSAMGLRMFTLFVSTTHPSTTISSRMKWAFSRLNMMSSSHCDASGHTCRKCACGSCKSSQLKESRQAHHVLKVAVERLDKSVDELEHSELILHRQWAMSCEHMQGRTWHTVVAHLILSLDTNDEKERGVPPVDDLVPPVLVK